MKSGRRKVIMDSKAGFTMIEAISGMVVMGIIAAVALGHNFDTQADVYAEASVVRSHLRYARHLALSDNISTWGISFDGNSYTLQEDGSASSLALPGSGSSTYSVASGVTVPSGLTVTFDDLGSPGSSSVSIDIDGGEVTITVTANTGFIQ